MEILAILIIALKVISIMIAVIVGLVVLFFAILFGSWIFCLDRNEFGEINECIGCPKMGDSERGCNADDCSIHPDNRIWDEKRGMEVLKKKPKKKRK